MTAGTHQDVDDTDFDPGIHPPRPGLLLRIGVTGHRLNRIDEAAARRIAGKVESLLAALEDELHALRGNSGDIYDGEPRLRIVSAVAEGADRLVAEAALARGHELQVILPLPPQEYAMDFGNQASVDSFHSLLSRATAVYDLPYSGDAAGAREKGYETAGLLTLRQSDILIAVWDGDDVHGKGGTADVVASAVRSGIPVAWIDVSGQRPPQLLLARDNALLSVRFDLNAVPPEDFAARQRDIVRSLLAPPNRDTESYDRFVQFLKEPVPRWNLRIAYPLLLLVSGVRRIRWGDLYRPFDRTAAHAAWEAFWRKLPHDTKFAANRLECVLLRRYCWADGLATRYAQYFRSGYVANFLLSAAAVAMALVGLIAPYLKFYWVSVELALIGLILLNTMVGVSHRWHARWLDYRHLAEELRHLRFLALTASRVRTEQALDEPSTEESWVTWYSAATQREIGLPTATADDSYVASIRSILCDVELPEQQAYHSRNAEMAHVLHRRLHRAGLLAFWATALVCFAFLVAYAWNHDEAVAWAPLTTFLTALLPAFGAALYGIRIQGDFEGVAHRSRSMVIRLEEIQAHAPQRPDLHDISSLAGRSSDAMLAEVADWRLVFRTRPLELPG